MTEINYFSMNPQFEPHDSDNLLLVNGLNQGVFVSYSKFIATGVALAFVSCTGAEDSNRRLKPMKAIADSSDVDDTSEDDAYIMDLTDAAAQPTETGKVKVTASVAGDLQEGRASRMASRAMKLADTDKSGSLTWDEFKAGADKLRERHKHRLKDPPNEAMKTKMEARIKADFDEFAGADASMDEEELESFLVYYAPRISHLRDRGLGFGDRWGDKDRDKEDKPRHQPQTWEQIVAKFDKNNDKMLDKDEFEALRAERRRP
jgi:hypothetical protein